MTYSIVASTMVTLSLISGAWAGDLKPACAKVEKTCLGPDALSNARETACRNVVRWSRLPPIKVQVPRYLTYNGCRYT